jgi:hypothetical protein
MKALVFASVLAAVATCAYAQSWNYRILPPPDFDKPFEGDLEIIRVSKEEIAALRPVPFPSTLFGCARRSSDGKSCRIVVLDDSALRRTPFAGDKVTSRPRGRRGERRQ